jgi:uncharacterized protein YecA (UPF0149 family)
MNGTRDLETVPDLRGFAAANELVGKTDDEIREANGDKFPKHVYHSIVCIDALTHKSRLVGNGNGAQAERNPKDPATWGKVGRNESCPCGSGKKFKHCHGKYA